LHLFSSLFVFFRGIASPQFPLRVRGHEDGAATAVRFETAAPGYTGSAIQTSFEPFSPGLPAGSGLSMAAVRRIVEAHRGSMEVGADPDRGVVITLSIPSASTLAAGSAATP
jgi:nitrogen-specific signal transduction histidine kinase